MATTLLKSSRFKISKLLLCTERVRTYIRTLISNLEVFYPKVLTL